MEKIFDEDTINELNGIYGIENCKWEILDYIRYLKISKENNFVNYNIMINNDSDYPFETKIRLIEFLYKRLKNNNIIATDYEFITQNQLKAFKKEDDSTISSDHTLKKKLICIQATRIIEPSKKKPEDQPQKPRTQKTANTLQLKQKIQLQ